MNFTYLFYQHIAFRKSCANCHYTNLQRPSDITLADYWGWERTDPTFNADDKGVSLVFCNTEKGRQLFEAVKDRLNTLPVDLPNAMQTHLEKPSELHPQRDEFEELYGKVGFKKTMVKFGFMGRKHDIAILKKKIKGKFKGLFKKIKSII